ncbi:unnamed protein product [Owenia fusiformis]|uniref:Uncharacterized protein n=1 Tax=Owenia fusiformis TaxID=6347 RepID=A0A8J1TXG9_OWEFU|nr:unnamed protein product [Owenia fusiformis]
MVMSRPSLVILICLLVEVTVWATFLKDYSKKSPMKECGLDIVWAIDTSCSISMENKLKVRDFVKKMTTKFDIGTSPNKTLMAAVAYDKGTDHQFYLNDNTDKKSLRKAASKIDLRKKGCKTFTFDALREAREVYFTAKHGDRPDVINILILITDGITFPWERQWETIEQAELLRNTGAFILVINLPNEFGLNNATEFEMIATPNSKIFRPNDFVELMDIMKTLKKSLCKVKKSFKRTIDIQGDNVRSITRSTPRPITDASLCPYGFLQQGDRDSCQVFMVGCDVRNPRCCGCNLVFRDPNGRKAPDWPSTLLRNDTCLCESCLTERCIPKKFVDDWRREKALAKTGIL